MINNHLNLKTVLRLDGSISSVWSELFWSLLTQGGAIISAVGSSLQNFPASGSGSAPVCRTGLGLLHICFEERGFLFQVL